MIGVALLSLGVGSGTLLLLRRCRGGSSRQGPHDYDDDDEEGGDDDDDDLVEMPSSGGRRQSRVIGEVRISKRRAGADERLNLMGVMAEDEGRGDGAWGEAIVSL